MLAWKGEPGDVEDVGLPLAARRPRAAVRQGRDRDRLEDPRRGARRRGLGHLAGAARGQLRLVPLPGSAVRIGLVPKLPVARIIAAGNVAGEGAKMVLLSAQERAAGRPRCWRRSSTSSCPAARTSRTCSSTCSSSRNERRRSSPAGRWRCTSTRSRAGAAGRSPCTRCRPRCTTGPSADRAGGRRAARPSCAATHDRLAVAYADCGSYGALDAVCERHGVARLPGEHCYDVLAGPRAQELLAEEPGTYFLTDFLVRTFERWSGARSGSTATPSCATTTSTTTAASSGSPSARRPSCGRAPSTRPRCSACRSRSSRRGEGGLEAAARSCSSAPRTEPRMKRRADVVIIGAGIVGCSAAHYLTLAGVQNVVVIDQGPLERHGRLVVPRARPRLPDATARGSCARSRSGRPSSTAASTGPRARAGSRSGRSRSPRRRRASPSSSAGTTTRCPAASPARSSRPAEAARLVPLLDPAAILAAYHVESDGLARAGDICRQLRSGAEARGAEFNGLTRVTGVTVEGGRVRGVETTGGPIATSTLLVCAGIWGPEMQGLVGRPIPMQPMQHLFAWTDPLPELAGATRETEHPILRHQDRDATSASAASGYGIGSLRARPDPDRVARARTAAPRATRSPRAIHARALRRTRWDATRTLVPPVYAAGVAESFNGHFSFTPDSYPLLGESSHTRGLFFAEGIWVTHAGGSARAITDLIVRGTPGIDLGPAHPDRFQPHHSAPAFVRARGNQQYVEVYDICTRCSRWSTRAACARRRTTSVSSSGRASSSRAPAGSARSGSSRTRRSLRHRTCSAAIAGARCSGRRHRARAPRDAHRLRRLRPHAVHQAGGRGAGRDRLAEPRLCLRDGSADRPHRLHDRARHPRAASSATSRSRGWRRSLPARDRRRLRPARRRLAAPLAARGRRRAAAGHDRPAPRWSGSGARAHATCWRSSYRPTSARASPT